MEAWEGKNKRARVACSRVLVWVQRATVATWVCVHVCRMMMMQNYVRPRQDARYVASFSDNEGPQIAILARKYSSRYTHAYDDPSSLIEQVRLCVWIAVQCSAHTQIRARSVMRARRGVILAAVPHACSEDVWGGGVPYTRQSHAVCGR